MKKSIICLSLLLTIGILSVFAGLFLMFYFDMLIKKTIIENVILKNGSNTFEKWRESRGYLNFYFFNVTNAEEVASKNVKPKVEELGPYRYREEKRKVDVKFSDDCTTVSYREQRYFIFDTSKKFSEDDVIFVLNLPAIVVSKIVEEQFPEFVAFALQLVFKSEKLFEQRKVKEVIWGYNATWATEINKILETFGFPKIHFPEFGLYVGNRSNGSISETFNISTGLNNVELLGRINLWDDKDFLPYWSGKFCNRIDGTDGTFWPPFVNKSSNLSVFSTDVCRSLRLSYSDDHKILNARVFKFIVPPSAFQDFRNVSEFQCFCVPNVESCLKQGVLDVSNCNGGAPIVLSLPHFLYSDQDYLDAIEGISPSVSKHETFISIEPNLGMALQAHKRLQINILLKNYKAFLATKNIKKYILFPLAWADEHGSLTSKDAEELDVMLYRPIRVAGGIQFGLIAFGCFCILLIILVVILKMIRPQKVKNENAVNETSPLLS